MVVPSRALGSAIAWAACGLLVACLEIADTEEGTADAGSGGSGAAATGGASGSGGGFVWVSCDTCGASQCECVPPAPKGWSVVRIAEGKLTSCPEGGEAPLVVGTQAVDTGCQPCACGNVLGGTCGVQLELFKDGFDCNKNPTPGQIETTEGACVQFFDLAKMMKLRRVREGGSCEPGSSLTLPPELADPKSVCKAKSGGTCGEGGACVAKASAPFGPSACVMADIGGELACPDGYPNKIPYAESFDDTRKCSCPCKVTGGCTGGVAHYNCTGETVDQLDQCVQFKITNFQVSTLPTATPGGCEPEGPPAVSSGKVTASGLRVVCCR